MEAITGTNIFQLLLKPRKLQKSSNKRGLDRKSTHMHLNYPQIADRDAFLAGLSVYVSPFRSKKKIIY